MTLGKTALSQDELRSRIGSWDVVGDMAIVVIPDELREDEKRIGEAILRSNNSLRVVARREGQYRGEYRTVSLKIIAGEKRKITETRESGVRLRLNPEDVYYSVRSGNERRRIASCVTPGESVLVPFSGIGPYPLVIAHCSRSAKVIGIEKNPKAHRFALENLRLNPSLQGRVRFFEGDAKVLLSDMHEMFDRIVMPLPTAGKEFLMDCIPRLVDGGWLHYYSMEKTDNFWKAQATVTAAAGKIGREIVNSRVVKAGHCAPRTYRICVDVQLA